MKTVLSSHKIPVNSIIDKGFVNIDYCDSFCIDYQVNKSVDELLNLTFKVPEWVNILMKIRNFIVRPFGLKADDNEKFTPLEFYPIGSKSGYFEILDRTENEIVMGESDKHLDFRVSVMKKANGNSFDISMTTIVKFNNILGRLYFLPVKPFHKLICKSLINKLVVCRK